MRDGGHRGLQGFLLGLMFAAKETFAISVMAWLGAAPSATRTRVWVLAATAALAEIWSTALMLDGPEEIPGILAAEAEITGDYAEIHGKVEAFLR